MAELTGTASATMSVSDKAHEKLAKKFLYAPNAALLGLLPLASIYSGAVLYIHR